MLELDAPIGADGRLRGVHRETGDYLPAVLNCTHHIMWVRPVEHGLHQCILCHQVVGRKDVYPKLEDLPPDVQKRWDAHEATRPAVAQPEARGGAPAAKPDAPEPKPPAAEANATAEGRSAAAAPRPAVPPAKPVAPEPPGAGSGVHG